MKDTSWFSCILYTQWSKIIQFQKLSILGGEPLLHKDLFNWILFLNKTWPKSENLQCQVWHTVHTVSLVNNNYSEEIIF